MDDTSRTAYTIACETDAPSAVCGALLKYDQLLAASMKRAPTASPQLPASKVQEFQCDAVRRTDGLLAQSVAEETELQLAKIRQPMYES